MEAIIDSIKTKDLQPDDVNVVIFHSPCSDGTGSELCAKKYLNEKFPDKDVKYYPMAIGALPPQGLEGKNVLICDYSYRKDVLNDLLTKVNKLLIIDHHLSAEKDLENIDDKNKIFSMNFSGAMLTWFYFFPQIESPLLIKYIQDRDIWTKKLSHTDDFASWFYTLPMTYEEYSKYLDDDLLLEMINTKGISYGELNNINIIQAVDYAVPKFCKIKTKYYMVAYLNTTVLKSDIGNKIFNEYPLIDFSAVYSINDATDSTSFSLRSTNKHADVSKIAFDLGGGGHRNASGIKVDYVTNYLPGKIIDNGQLYSQLYNIRYEQYNDKYNIVYMQSSVYQYELGSYLLQNKYSNKDSHVQVCQTLLSSNDGQSYPTMDIAAVWSYDVVCDTTKFTVVINKSDQDKLDIISDLGFDVNEPVIYDGSHKTIPTDISLIIK